jgi:hypothetical protein
MMVNRFDQENITRAGAVALARIAGAGPVPAAAEGKSGVDLRAPAPVRAPG